MRSNFFIGCLLFLGGLVACSNTENPCLKRAELGCEMGLALAQGEEITRVKEECEKARQSAEEADEEQKKRCAEDINAVQTIKAKTPETMPQQPEPGIRRSTEDTRQPAPAKNTVPHQK